MTPPLHTCIFLHSFQNHTLSLICRQRQCGSSPRVSLSSAPCHLWRRHLPRPALRRVQPRAPGHEDDGSGGRRRRQRAARAGEYPPKGRLAVVVLRQEAVLEREAVVDGGDDGWDGRCQAAAQLVEQADAVPLSICSNPFWWWSAA